MGRAAGWRHPLRPRSRDRRRLLPLTISFGILSFALTLALGVVLGGLIQHQVKSQSEAGLDTSTRIATVITIHTIVSGLNYGSNGIPLTNSQRVAQVNAISSDARVLVDNSDVVGVSAVLADGTMIGGVAGPSVGSKVRRTVGFSAALRGLEQNRTLLSSSSGMTATEQRLVRKYGTVSLVQQGVRLSPGGPIRAVVSTYTALGPTDRQAASDTRSILLFLALGLLVFWAVLFRLVLGASRALKRESKAVVHLATHDSLTGLPNRVLLRDRTERAIVASRRSGVHVALILMNLDRFKEINDALGHSCGDSLLKLIGPRLRDHLRDSDTIARVGGDEFVVMLPDLRSQYQALAVAEQLATALQAPFLVDGVMIDVGTSAGVVSTPEHGSDFDDLLRHADVAMYAAKEHGYQVLEFDPMLDAKDAIPLGLLADLRMALIHPDQILVYYQPQLDLATGSISGVEALVRWEHPVRGLLSPDAFIPFAERTGIIRPLTWCIMRKALEQTQRWAEDGLLMRASVNISPRCLLEAGFADGVARLLTETEVPAERLELELTETAIMTDPKRALVVLQDLARQGIRLSIDDFGTGYSSLAYLKDLPVSEMKIDQTFISGMESDVGNVAIVRSCLDLARNLDLTVVAEGVETREVLQQLTELGCPTVQGYYVSRPLSPEDFTEWMTSREQHSRLSVRTLA
jgi:diguanylate cyclase (GGDEF)-like protein